MSEIIVTFEPEKSAEKYSQEEIDAYIERGREKYGSKLNGITLKEVDNPDEVEIYYDVGKVPSFQRLRRITGYLVGTLDRWNDAKRSEEHDRVKHDVG